MPYTVLNSQCLCACLFAHSVHTSITDIRNCRCSRQIQQPIRASHSSVTTASLSTVLSLPYLGSGYLTDRNGMGARLTVTTLVQTVGMSLLLVWRFCRLESTHSALSTVAATCPPG